jgi:hypothetical protein
MRAAHWSLIHCTLKGLSGGKAEIAYAETLLERKTMTNKKKRMDQGANEKWSLSEYTTNFSAPRNFIIA